MGNRKKTDPESIRKSIEQLIKNFESQLATHDLREKVLALIPLFYELRDLGQSFIPKAYAKGARKRILYYFQKYQGYIINGDELLVISGIQEYARRIRELRVQFGWSITSGNTIREMENDENLPDYYKSMKPDDYVLLSKDQDLEAAYRWNIANQIRKETGAVKEKLLKFLRANVGKMITNEELRYVAGGKTEWARRTRELRTEHGWPISTKMTGRPDLEIGIYILEADRQAPEHDRKIPDPIRGEVLRRDQYKCTNCQWSYELWNPSDPRHLELHHLNHHAKGGKNDKENLVTLCNTCHDKAHHKADQ
jgi:hypothetical protein